jgi:D-3-phosphoglycerate dehydrogenase
MPLNPASITTPKASASPALRAVFVDANPALGEVAQKLLRPGDVPFTIDRRPDIRSEALPATLAGAEIAVIDHTRFPTAIARECTGLRHVVFLGELPVARAYRGHAARCDPHQHCARRAG